MEYTSELSIGVPELDEQHAQLFECIARLESGTDEHQRELDGYYIMEELRENARVHFSVEEIVMRLFDYPELAAHAAQHREFMARLKSFEEGELVHGLHAQAGKSLREWLAHHITVADKHYAAHLLGSGRRL